MRSLWSIVAICIVGAGSLTGLGAPFADEPANEDEAAVRKVIDSYVDAFNKADAKSLAAHWSEGGEYVTPAGETLRGRQQLEESFAAYFDKTKDAKLELVGTMIQFLSPHVAVEKGTARVIVPDKEPNESEYEVLHVKTAEGWRMDRVSEQEEPAVAPSHYDKLQSLEWMIGTWEDADENATVTTTCRWTTNQNFIVRSFKVFIEDRVDFEGTQIIGWDPANETIRSWLFDSDGSFGAGRWSQEKDRWTVKSLQVLADGRRASSTNIMQVIDDNTITFQSIGRQVDGELLPNIGPIELRRSTN